MAWLSDKAMPAFALVSCCKRRQHSSATEANVAYNHAVLPFAYCANQQFRSST